jgi:hypothetical protein
MRWKPALLLLILPSLHAAEPPAFRFDLRAARAFTLTRSTVVLDDDEKGVPHRFAATGTSEGTVTRAADGTYTVVLKPTNYVVKLDGYSAADKLVEVMKASTITMTIDNRGVAQSVSGVEELQRLTAHDVVSREILGRDVQSTLRAAWNDRLTLLGHPATPSTTWEVKESDGTPRRWSVTGTEPCPAPACVAVQSRWEAESASLLKQANSAEAAKRGTEIKDARITTETNLVVDPATLWPYHETMRQSTYLRGTIDKKKVERRTTRTIESDYVWHAQVP